MVKQAMTMTKKTKPLRTVVKSALAAMLMLLHCSRAKRTIAETAVN